MVTKTFSHICSILFVMVFMLAQAPLQGVHAAGVRYATLGGTGGCSSWADACSLQSALTGASSGDEIWAEAGTYKPTTGSDRSATFQLKDGVAVYGGFAGGETLREERDPAAHVTILSGEIGSAGNADNSYHVVTGVTGATLDGFTITAGNANGNSSCPDIGCAGGMLNDGGNLTLTDIIFSDNLASYGGGMVNWGGNPTLTNVSFNGNTASVDGGGMYNVNDSNPTLTNVTFNDNSAGHQGGGMHNRGLHSTITNATFSGNSANQGGAMYNTGSNPWMVNVTFSSNSAVDHGGGMFIDGYSHPSFRDTIFWGNTAAGGIGGQIYANSGGADAYNSLVQGGCADGSWTCAGMDIITTDPKLGTLGNYGGFTQTIPLQAGSSAIDMGNDSTCATKDQRGLARPQGIQCDIGAFEVEEGTLGALKAVPGGLTSGSCESWADACELRYALTSVLSGQEIWAAAGTYKPTAGMDRSASFQLKSAVALYGGFAGGETARYQRDPAANPTILSGDLNGDDVGFTNNSENSYHVVTSASVTILDGFNITAGNANGDSPNDSGGGMYNDQASSFTLKNVTFSGNTASSSGGGMFNNSSSPTLTNITFSGNRTSGDGGGIFNNTSSPTLTSSTFSSNSADKGGALYNSGSSPVMINVTFYGNSAVNHGGGMFIADLSYPQFRDTIFWGNTAAGGIGGQIYNYSGNTTSSDSVVQGGCADGSWSCGSHIITTDPKLGKLGIYGGYTQTIPLLPGSSAIDAGNPSYCTIGSDQRGLDYVRNCDIGSFESQGFSLTISGGNNQSTLINTTFPLPLKVEVTALNAVEPVNGGQVVFMAPASGASATMSGSPATIAGGSASVTAMANGSVGSYQVMASAAGAGSVAFNLENLYKIFLPLVLR